MPGQVWACNRLCILFGSHVQLVAQWNKMEQKMKHADKQTDTCTWKTLNAPNIVFQLQLLPPHLFLSLHIDEAAGSLNVPSALSMSLANDAPGSSSIKSGLGAQPEWVDCIQASEMCNQDPQCSSRYRVMRQCLVGKEKDAMLDSNRECQAALEVLLVSPLFDCRCKRVMKKEPQCLQIFWSIHMGRAEGRQMVSWSHILLHFNCVNSFKNEKYKNTTLSRGDTLENYTCIHVRKWELSSQVFCVFCVSLVHSKTHVDCSCLLFCGRYATYFYWW